METVTLMVFWTTRREMLRTFATIRRQWRTVSRQFVFGERDARFALESMRRMSRDIRWWSAPSDLARVDVTNCSDLKCLLEAVDRAMPRAKVTMESLRHITDAASVGYWGAEPRDTEEYQRTPDGWVMTREGDEEYCE